MKEIINPRLFGIPYNGEDPDYFVEKLLEYKKYIYYIYIDFFQTYDGIYNHTLNMKPNKIITNTYLFDIIQTKLIDIPIYLDLSNVIPVERDFNIKSIKSELLDFLNSGRKVDGLIFSSYIALNFLYRYFLIYDKSKNRMVSKYKLIFSDIRNLRSMETLKEKFGIFDFILNKSMIRNYKFIEYLRNHTDSKVGHRQNFNRFQLYGYINNNCFYECPSYEDCKFLNITGRDISTRFCYDYLPVYELRRNYIVPRWLNKYDDVIDIFILEKYNTLDTFKVLDKYLKEENENLKLGEIIETAYKDIPVKDIHTKIATCMGAYCAFSCDTCEKKIKEFGVIEDVL